MFLLRHKKNYLELLSVPLLSGALKVHCNAVITQVTGAIKSNRVISDTAL